MTTSASFSSARVAWLVVAAAALLAASPASRAAGTPIEKRAAVNPSGSVEVSNVSGSVTVTGWDRSEVEVTGELGKGAERLDFATQDNVTRIKVVLPDRSYHVDDTDLVIHVPAASRLSVNTVSADIKVQGVQGAQRLQSVSADIHTEAGSEDVECKTVSGDVAVNGSGKKGLLTVTTVSGDATLLKVAGEVNASTVSGNLVLGLGVTERSRLRSTSGDLTLAMRLDREGKVDAESISGDVRLNLVGAVDAEFDVSTFSGEIRNCFGPKPVSTSEYTPGKELRFREGQGLARIRIKTLNGDVNVCRK
jgi:DUF4097 and DUF4098 domain-containing protein YvlB